MGSGNDRYDLIVIGAGPGGYVAAIRASQLGMRVACVDKEEQLGGTCLRVGCIPSKALLDSTELCRYVLKDLKAHGIFVSDWDLYLSDMLRRKDQVVQTLTQGVAGLFKKNKITRFTGAARIIEPGRVRVTGPDESELASEHLLIATGSAPSELDALPFDGERIVSSTEALSFESIPERLLIVGAGYIGLELGSVWSRLGSDVFVVEMMDQILPGMDPEMARALQKVLEKPGFEFRFSSEVTQADVKDDQVVVRIEDGDGESSEVTVDNVLVAVGRRAYTEGLGLDNLEIETDKRGRIVVDEHYRTSVEGIYAVGDVIDRGPMLAHVAQEEGIACVERIAGQAGHVNYEAIPAAVYTWPELAWVGKSEAQCEAEGIETRIGKFPFRANGRARMLGEVEGFVKLITDARTDRVLGVFILGPRASDLVAECVVAMEFGASAEDIARTCHAHPSFPEVIKEAALDANGRALHV